MPKLQMQMNKNLNRILWNEIKNENSGSCKNSFVFICYLNKEIDGFIHVI